MSEQKLKLEDLLGKKTSQKEDTERTDYAAIIGAGALGLGIAQTIAASGIDIVVIEKDEVKLKNAEKSLSETIDREIIRWSMTKSEKKSILSKIKWSLDYNLIKECDLIIEAVDEDLELKKSIFRELDKVAKAGAIFFTSASTISVSKIAEGNNRADKIIGVHFINPAQKVQLVEVVPGVKTSENTLKRVKKIISRIGKISIEISDVPGLVTTRSVLPLLNEAIYILNESALDARGIDESIKLGFNFPIGPLEMADAMGLDNVLLWMENLSKSLNENRFTPCPILKKLVSEKKYGKKTGEGFYKYDDEGKIIS